MFCIKLILRQIRKEIHKNIYLIYGYFIDPNRNPQDEELPIIVTITLPTVPKYCTGSLIKDLKILVKTQCFFNNGVIYNKDLRIRFPNDKTLYKPNSTDYDGDVGIITVSYCK